MLLYIIRALDIGPESASISRKFSLKCNIRLVTKSELYEYRFIHMYSLIWQVAKLTRIESMAYMKANFKHVNPVLCDYIGTPVSKHD